ncbi:hypothetical protein ACPDHL_14100 [Myroides sp. C15-4]|uniref:hypothetical protein n=1 Tax=Myroides sp. C15-4 TaxID=3400532 RepID=UPI003D2F6F5A
MKKLVLCFFSLVLFASCSSDDSSSNATGGGESKTELKLKSVEFGEIGTDPSNNEMKYKTTIEYFYGSNGYVNKIKTHEETTNLVEYEYFEYEGNNIIQWRYEVDGRQVKSDFFYTDNLITKSINTEENGPHINVYEYDSAKNLITAIYTNESDNFVRTSRFTYDTNGNVTKETIDYTDGTQIIHTYEFDQKNHPFTHMFPKNYLKRLSIGKHNKITEKQDGVTQTTTTYEYNDLGYPIKEIYEYKTIHYTYY